MDDYLDLLKCSTKTFTNHKTYLSTVTKHNTYLTTVTNHNTYLATVSKHNTYLSTVTKHNTSLATVTTHNTSLATFYVDSVIPLSPTRLRLDYMSNMADSYEKNHSLPFTITWIQPRFLGGVGFLIIYVFPVVFYFICLCSMSSVQCCQCLYILFILDCRSIFSKVYYLRSIIT